MKKTIFALIFAFSFLLAISPVFAWSSGLNRGLIAYWNMNNTNDSINGLTFLNFSAIANNTFNNSLCLYGSCFQATGTDIMQLYSPTLVNFSEDFTFNIWTQEGEFAGSRYFFGKGDVSNPYDFAIGDDGSGKIYVGDPWWDGEAYSRASAFTNGTWHMWTIVYNKTRDNVTFYFDGSIEYSNRGTTIENFGNRNLTIGARFNNDYQWVGQIDEFSYWNRQLSYAEISTNLYNSGSGVTFDPSTILSIQYVSPTDNNGDWYNRKNIIVNVSTTGQDNITINLYNSTGFVNSAYSTNSPFYNNFSVATDGTYYFNATTCNLAGCLSTSTYTINIDTTNPITDIIFPEDYLEEPTEAYFNVKPAIINFTATNTGLIDSCWFSIDNGTINVSVPNCSGVGYNNFSGFDSYVVEGTNVLTLWANDSVSLISSPHIHIFFVDSILPNVQYVSPTIANNTDINDSNSIIINVTATDLHLANITITLYNSTGDRIDSHKTLTSPNYHSFNSLPVGIYYVNAEATDSYGNTNSTAINYYNVSFVPLPPIPPAYLNSSLYQLIAGSGTGLGVFIHNIASGIGILLILLGVLAMIIMVGYTLAHLVKKHIGNI